MNSYEDNDQNEQVNINIQKLNKALDVLGQLDAGPCAGDFAAAFRTGGEYFDSLKKALESATDIEGLGGVFGGSSLAKIKVTFEDGSVKFFEFGEDNGEMDLFSEIEEPTY